MKKKLEYGKWYSCNECMPEDFEELLDVEISSKEVLIHFGNEDFDISFRRKHIYDDNKWRWCYGNNYITNWMAIPKLEE